MTQFIAEVDGRVVVDAVDNTLSVVTAVGVLNWVVVGEPDTELLSGKYW